jgi:hypothetical protein
MTLYSNIRGGSVKHIENKNDWFYEFRPQLILFFGLLGLLSQLFMPSVTLWTYFSQACGLVLIITAFKIYEWRRNYREGLRQMRHRSFQ